MRASMRTSMGESRRPGRRRIRWSRKWSRARVARHGALGRAEDQRMGDTVGPTHPRCSAEHFAALDDGRAVTAVLALATRRILSCDLKG